MAFAYNTSHHSITHFTPYILTYGGEGQVSAVELLPTRVFDSQMIGSHSEFAFLLLTIWTLPLGVHGYTMTQLMTDRKCTMIKDYVTNLMPLVHDVAQQSSEESHEVATQLEGTIYICTSHKFMWRTGTGILDCQSFGLYQKSTGSA